MSDRQLKLERSRCACRKSEKERTFAVMAFGFLVEKFDLFLEFAAPSLAGRTLSLPGQKFVQHSGTGVYRSRHCDGRHCSCSLCDDREEYRPRRPAPGNRIANRHRICGAAGPSGLRSIPFDARPCNEALTDFRKRFAVFFRDENNMHSFCYAIQEHITRGVRASKTDLD
jgi:hypothetical protein